MKSFDMMANLTEAQRRRSLWCLGRAHSVRPVHTLVYDDGEEAKLLLLTEHLTFLQFPRL